MHNQKTIYKMFIEHIYEKIGWISSDDLSCAPPSG